jgi:hypothetical protein
MRQYITVYFFPLSGGLRHQPPRRIKPDQRYTPRHTDHLSGDKGRHLRAKEQDGIADVFRLTDSA